MGCDSRSIGKKMPELKWEYEDAGCRGAKV
jgi:hypothetical protein